MPRGQFLQLALQKQARIRRGLQEFRLRDVFEHGQARGAHQRIAVEGAALVAMFVDQSDAASIQASVDAGVSAYIVDGLKKERIKPILDLCISRFNAFSKLQDELDRTKSALEERKVIDRAKGILMKVKGLTEDEAYVLMRSTAMREKKKIGEIAQSILTASELLK